MDNEGALSQKSKKPKVGTFGLLDKSSFLKGKKWCPKSDSNERPTVYKFAKIGVQNVSLFSRLKNRMLKQKIDQKSDPKQPKKTQEK